MNWEMDWKELKALRGRKVLDFFALKTRCSSAWVAFKIVSLIGAGALVGGGVALLCARKSGRDLRKEFRRYTRNRADEVLDMLPDERDDLEAEGA